MSIFVISDWWVCMHTLIGRSFFPSCLSFPVFSMAWPHFFSFPLCEIINAAHKNKIGESCADRVCVLGGLANQFFFRPTFPYWTFGLCGFFLKTSSRFLGQPAHLHTTPQYHRRTHRDSGPANEGHPFFFVFIPFQSDRHDVTHRPCDEEVRQVLADCASPHPAGPEVVPG